MKTRSRMFIAAMTVVAAVICVGGAIASDWPYWGGGASRNMVSAEKAPLPASATIAEPAEGDKIDPSAAKNVKWAVKLGSQTYGNPTVAGGRVFVGTNNDSPRDTKH